YLDHVTNWWLLILIVLVQLAVIGWLISLANTDATAASRRSGTAYAMADGSGRGRAPSGGGTDTAPAISEQTRTDGRLRAAIVVNPTKFQGAAGTARIRSELEAVCRKHGWAEPLWLETTIEDPGYGQTKQALAEGVDLVCALGGDGTVRIVGSALVGTDVPMGLLSGGTGNLLARNLSLPVTNPAQGLAVALTGRDHRIDTATLRLRRPLFGADDEEAPPPVDTDDLDELPPLPGEGQGEVEDHIFLVMAGLGFDAEVMANAPEKLKKQMGWGAYIFSAAQLLRGPQFKVHIRTDEDDRLNRRVRSVLVGNVGKLTPGLNLVPQAKADDGILDMVLLAPKGLVGWGAVLSSVVTRQTKGHPRMEFFTMQTVEVIAEKPVEIQLDGDTLGRATAMTVTVNPQSLVIRQSA
ncbi:MAG TPA: diacylglycerol kinase family protein, partial [Ornithinicoccus sp.]|nr:diacylglycerol kinase family protein [Ornithinicoccus sp.]